MTEFGEYMLELFENPKKLLIFSKNGSDLMKNNGIMIFIVNCLNKAIDKS